MDLSKENSLPQITHWAERWRERAVSSGGTK